MSLSLLVFIVASLASGTRAIEQCTQRDFCSCTTENNKVINLKPLSQNPPMQDEDGDYIYEWNPCDNFQYKEMTVGALQRSKDGQNYYSLGYNGDMTTSTGAEAGDAVFHMVEQNMPADRESKLVCKCTESSNGVTFKFTGHSSGMLPILYRFELSAPHCCPGYVPSSEGEGLSVGSVLCIIFFSLLFGYFLFGVVYQTAVRKSEGIQRIPNVTRWAALPGLIKDGFIFTFTRGKGSKSGYGQI